MMAWRSCSARDAVPLSLGRMPMNHLDGFQMSANRILITLILGALVLAFLAIAGVGILRETAGTNSYALLADAWLNGRLDTQGACFDGDCAVFEGRTYVIFPPMPAVLISPFVAIFGSDFQFFMPLSLLAFAAIGLMWWRIADQESASADLTRLITLTVLFATPLFFVMLRGDRIWFFAQLWGFLFASASLYFALVRKDPLLAGLCLGAAFLSRQMTILYAPLLYLLLLEKDARLFRIDLPAIKRVLTLAVFPTLAVAIYHGYNYIRFGDLLDTGYGFIFTEPPTAAGAAAGAFLKLRLHDIGMFAPDYVLFNVVHMFLQGPHLEFVGTYLTEMGSFDRNGASVLVTTPVLLLALLAPRDRQFWLGIGTCAVILCWTLFYYSSGYSQFSAQRYTLDWLPILLLFYARALKPEFVPHAALLIGYSMFLTLGMIVIGGLSAA
jgi:hypothetical protein